MRSGRAFSLGIGTGLIVPPNAAVQRPRAALTRAAYVHNEMTHLRRARAAGSRSAATACSATLTAPKSDCRVSRAL